jgi:uncharacterized protein (TIGR04255 family)
MKEIQLNKPPIREAIFEVLLDYSHSPDLELLQGFGKVISQSFPNKNNIIQVSGNLNEDAGKTSSVNRTTFGIAFFSTDKNSSIQVRKNGFSFIVLNQTYSCWDDFKPKAFEYLKQFIDYINPKSINRLSLRFINQIALPTNAANLNEYLLVLPSLGNYTYSTQDILLRVELSNEKINAIGIITEVIKPPFNETINLYFDIDVIKKIEYVNNQIDLKLVEKEFEDLRTFKNELFFESLTDKTFNLFK